jgi:hypothetical protein
MMIVNDNSSVINKLEASLTDDARVVIFNCHMFIVQVTGFVLLAKNFFSMPQVTQISCFDKNRAPSGCTQYFYGTSATGMIMSFNYANSVQLASQKQRFCFRSVQFLKEIPIMLIGVNDLSIKQHIFK